MKLTHILGAAACALLFGALPAAAQSTARMVSRVVAACGTPPYTYAVGSYEWTLQDTTGEQCTNASGGGGGSNPAAGATGSAVPADASYNGLNVGGGTLRGQTGVNPSGSVYAGQTDVTSVNGVTALTGAGATGAGSPRVTAAQDANTVAGAAPLTTGIYVTGPSAAALSTAAAQANQLTQETSTASNTSTIAAAVGSAIPACTTTPCTVQIGNVAEVPMTAGGPTVATFEPAASDNHTNLKNGAGQIYWVTAFNNSATINYIRFYNAGTGFNGCNSATNLVAVAHIPANTSDAGFVLNVPSGIPFSTGISYCVVSAYGQNTTTNATASAMDISVGYK